MNSLEYIRRNGLKHFLRMRKEYRIYVKEELKKIEEKSKIEFSQLKEFEDLKKVCKMFLQGHCTNELKNYGKPCSEKNCPIIDNLSLFKSIVSQEKNTEGNLKYWICSECREITEDCKAACKLITDSDIDLTTADNTCNWSHYNNLSEVFSNWQEVSELEFKNYEISSVKQTQDEQKGVEQ